MRAMTLDNKKRKINISVVQLVLTFFLGAVMGWCWEIFWIYATTGVLANRGVLHGPWLPIYGTGCVLMLILKKIIGNKPIRFFFASMAVCGVIEYITSWVLEMVYHTRWWDYSNTFMNLNGRICLICLLFFGFGGSIVVYFVLPKLKKYIEKFSDHFVASVAFILMVVFVIDALLSIIVPNMGLGITTM